MNLLINALTIASLSAFTGGLVHHVQMTYKDKTCTGNGKTLKLWEFKRDNRVCGGIMCHNEKGDALIYYCQQLPFFLSCYRKNDRIIDTTIAFPDCCWHCVRVAYCDKRSANIVELGGKKAVGKGKEKGDMLKLDNKSNKGSAAKPNDKLKKEEKKESSIAKPNDKYKKEDKNVTDAKPDDKYKKEEKKETNAKSIDKPKKA